MIMKLKLRTETIILFIAIILLFFSFYLASSARNTVIAQRQSLSDFQYTNQCIPSNNQTDLLVLIEQSAQQAGLSLFITQVQQTQAHAVLLSFNAVPFDQLIAWLQKLTIKDNIRIEKLSAIKSNTVGVVKADVFLSRNNYSAVH